MSDEPLPRLLIRRRSEDQDEQVNANNIVIKSPSAHSKQEQESAKEPLACIQKNTNIQSRGRESGRAQLKALPHSYRLGAVVFQC
jgi:hypothetical protein